MTRLNGIPAVFTIALLSSVSIVSFLFGRVSNRRPADTFYKNDETLLHQQHLIEQLQKELDHHVAQQETRDQLLNTQITQLQLQRTANSAGTPCPPCKCDGKEGGKGGGKGDGSKRNAELEEKVAQVVSIMQRYIQAYAFQSQDMILHEVEIRRQLKAAGAPLPATPIFPKRKKPLHIAILTPQEGPSNLQTQLSTYTKEKYAQLHNYTFIFDTSAYAANHTRHATWNRVPSLQKYLPKYDWIFYLDSDIAIANASILLEDFIEQFPPETNIAFTDGLEGFNAGAFFIRNTDWSYWLLDAWWNASESNPGKFCWRQKESVVGFQRCKFQWNDQVSLWDVMLPYYEQQQAKIGGPKRKNPCKTSPSTYWDKSIKCYRDSMVDLGRTYGKRSGFHFHFWPLEKDPRGWTFFLLDRRGLSVWPENELFHPGDFTLHSHDEKAIKRFSLYRVLHKLESNGYLNSTERL